MAQNEAIAMRAGMGWGPDGELSGSPTDNMAEYEAENRLLAERHPELGVGPGYRPEPEPSPADQERLALAQNPRAAAALMGRPAPTTPAELPSAADIHADYQARPAAPAASSVGGLPSASDIYAEYHGQDTQPAALPAPTGSDFGRGFQGSLIGMKNMLTGTAALAADAADRAFGGSTWMGSVRDWAQQAYDASTKQEEAQAKPTDEITNVHTVGDFGHWLLYQAGQGAGFLSVQTTAALVGGAIGATMGPEGAVGGAVAGAVDSGFVRGGIQKLAAGLVARQMEAAAAKGVTLTEATAVKAAQAQVVAAGRIAGAGAFNEAIMPGATYEEGRRQAAAEGREQTGGDLEREAIFGTLAAFTGTIANKLGLETVQKGGLSILQGMGLPARVAGGAALLGAGGAAEMTGMTALQRAGAGQPLTGDEANNAYINAAATGGVMGAPIGAVGGIRSVKAPPVADVTKDAVPTILQAGSVDEAIQHAMGATGAATQLMDQFHQEVNAHLAPSLEDHAAAAALLPPLNPDELLAAAAMHVGMQPGDVGPGSLGERMLTDNYLRNIEQRGGAALPEEAAHLTQVGAGAPYDRVLPAIPSSEPAGARVDITQPTPDVLAGAQRMGPAGGKVLADLRAGRITSEEAGKAVGVQAPEVGGITQPELQDQKNPRMEPGTTEGGIVIPSPVRAGDTVPLGADKGAVTVVDKDQLPELTPATPTNTLTRQTAGLLSDIGRIFGKQVEVFQGSNLDGFVHTDHPDTIFINQNSGASHLAIFGHEMLHLMKRDSPDAAAAFMDAVTAKMTPEAAEKFKADYGAMPGEVKGSGTLGARGIEEFSADTMGNHMAQPAFWTDVFNRIGAKDQQGTAQVSRLGALLERTVRSVLRVVGGKGFAAEKMVKDFTGIREAAALALAKYAKDRAIPAREMEMARLKSAHDVARMPLAREKPAGEAPMRAHFEVAPDPRDKAASAKWNKLPTEQRAAISQKAVREVLPKVLKLMGVKGGIHEQAGGWGPDQNPSMALTLSDEKNLPQVAKLLGYVFKQESTGIVAAHPFDGSSPADELRITLPKSMGYDEIKGVYDKLREIQNDKGEPAVAGHSTDVGGSDMRVLNMPEYSGMATPDLVRAVQQTLGEGYGVEAHGVHAAFPDTKELSYGPNGNAPGQGGTAADLLRNEATRVVGNELGRAQGGARRGPVRAEGGERVADTGAERGVANEVAQGVKEKTNEVAQGVKETTNEATPAEVSRPGNENAALPAPAEEGGRASPKRGQHAEDLVGHHFSTQPRAALLGHFYGTGLRGAEKARVMSATDNRLRSRSYFYINKGKGIAPEPGLGRHVHEARLDQMYNASDNPEKIPSRDMNEFESQVLDRGYKGYYIRSNGDRQGVAVRLGEHANVDVQHVGEQLRAPNRSDLPEDQVLASKRRAFTPDQLDENRRRVYAQVAKYLTPQEQTELTKKTAENLVDLVKQWPTNEKEMAAVAYAGRSKRGWYADTTEAIGNVFGPEAPRFAALLAATSPQTDVVHNFKIATNLWSKWVAAGRPQDEASIVRMGNEAAREAGAGWLHGSYTNNAMIALTHPDPVGKMLSGPKVDSFMRNLLGHVNEVTNDTWMSHFHGVASAIFGKKRIPEEGRVRGGKDAGYLAASIVTRKAADLLSKKTGVPWTPQEVQETVWSWAKTLAELGDRAGNTNRSLTDLLHSTEFDHDLIQATPDFRTLFHTGATERVLRDAGYGDQLDKLGAPADHGAAEPGAEPGATGEAAPFDQRTQGRLERSAAERIQSNRTPNRVIAEGEPTARQVSDEEFLASPQRQEETPEFKKYMEGAAIQTPMFHGTAQDVSAFRAKQAGATFLTHDAKFAEAFSHDSHDWMVKHANEVIGKERTKQLFDDATEWAHEQYGDDASQADIDERFGDTLKDAMPSGQNIMKLYTNVKRPFDYADPARVKAVVDRVMADPNLKEDMEGRKMVGGSDGYVDAAGLSRRLANGNWSTIENPRVQAAIKAEGHDAFHVREGGRKNLGVYDNAAIKSATGNRGTFDATNPDLRMSARRAQYGDLTKEQEDALTRVGALRPNETMRDVWDKAAANWKLKLTQGLVDEFRAIKDWSPEGYQLARLSKGSEGALESALLFGKPFMNGDVPDVKVDDPSGGFAKVLTPLQGEHQRFLQWVAAQRAEDLTAQGRENLYSQADIDALKGLDQGNFKDGSAREPVYAKALENLTSYNEAMLDIARQSGTLSDDLYQMFKDQPYVPFYRYMDEKDGTPRPASGLTSQYFSKRLKGGGDMLNPDLLDNLMRNWSHLLSSSAKNRAAVRAIDDMVQHGIAEPAEPGKNSVKIMRDGQDEHYEIHDPYAAQAMGAINYIAPSYLKPFGVMKRALTYGITASPIFKVRTLIRETLAATAQSEVSNNVVKNLAQGWKNTSLKSQVFASTLAGGGQIRFGSMERGSQLDKMIRRAGGVPFDENTMAKWSRHIGDIAEVYHEFGNRVENVNRTALYEQLRAKGYSHADASFASRDLLDFTASGRWPVVRFLTQSVPFMNARMQSMYALGRTAAQNPAKVGAVLAAITGASLGLMLTQQDEDWWKQREDFDRDAYWAFRVGEQAYYIPRPFELGAFGTLAERTWETAFGDMDLKGLGSNFGQTLLNTFSLDPTPQIIKPMWAVYANKDPFSQRPIESSLDQTLRPQDRYDENTSTAGRLLGDLGIPNPVALAQATYTPMSPKQIDYALRGYFGSMATFGMAVTDAITRPLEERGPNPAFKADQWSAGFVRDLPSNHSQYVEELYKKATEVHEAYASMREAAAQGDMAKAREIQTEEAPLLRAKPAIDAGEKQMSAINKMLRQVEASQMDPDTKRAMIDKLSQQRNAIASRVHQAMV